ncbi:hypothetical protein ACTFIW_013347 [Dictyostelium discoideum]
MLLKYRYSWPVVYDYRQLNKIKASTDIPIHLQSNNLNYLNYLKYYFPNNGSFNTYFIKSIVINLNSFVSTVENLLTLKRDTVSVYTDHKNEQNLGRTNQFSIAIRDEIESKYMHRRNYDICCHCEDGFIKKLFIMSSENITIPNTVERYINRFFLIPKTMYAQNGFTVKVDQVCAIFRPHGYPRTIFSDRDPRILSYMGRWAKKMDYKLKMAVADGKTEKINRENIRIFK